MSTIEIVSKIESLREWEDLATQAAAEIESLKDELKKYMDSLGVEELEAGTHIIRYTTVLSNRFNSTAFKKDMSGVYKAYVKQTISRRFTVSG